MKQKIFINLEKEVITGNVLDIGFENYGIIYNLYKQYNEDASIEYISGKNEKKLIQKDYYDNCIIFFALNKFMSGISKKRFLEEINIYLKDDGIINIWDMDKGYRKIFKDEINVLLPDRKIKIIKLKDYNIFKNNSKGYITKLLEKNFDIIDVKSSDNIYYIKAKKKGNKENEGTISRS